MDDITEALEEHGWYVLNLTLIEHYRAKDKHINGHVNNPLKMCNSVKEVFFLKPQINGKKKRSVYIWNKDIFMTGQALQTFVHIEQVE